MVGAGDGIPVGDHDGAVLGAYDDGVLLGAYVS